VSLPFMRCSYETREKADLQGRKHSLGGKGKKRSLLCLPQRGTCGHLLQIESTLCKREETLLGITCPTRGRKEKQDTGKEKEDICHVLNRTTWKKKAPPNTRDGGGGEGKRKGAVLASPSELLLLIRTGDEKKKKKGKFRTWEREESYLLSSLRREDGPALPGRAHRDVGKKKGRHRIRGKKRGGNIFSHNQQRKGWSPPPPPSRKKVGGEEGLSTGEAHTRLYPVREGRKKKEGTPPTSAWKGESP